METYHWSTCVRKGTSVGSGITGSDTIPSAGRKHELGHFPRFGLGLTSHKLRLGEQTSLARTSECDRETLYKPCVGTCISHYTSLSKEGVDS